MIEFGEEHLPDGVIVERSDDGSRIRLVADRPLAGLSNGWFTQPVASVEIDPATRAERCRVPRFRVHPIRPPGDLPTRGGLRLQPGAQPPLAASDDSAARPVRRRVHPVRADIEPARADHHRDRRRLPLGMARRPRRGARRFRRRAGGVPGCDRGRACWRSGGASCARRPGWSAVPPTPTRSRRTCRTGPTTVRPTGTAPNPARRSPPRWPTRCGHCAPTTFPFVRSNSTRGSTSTRRSGRSTRSATRPTCRRAAAGCGSRGPMRSRPAIMRPIMLTVRRLDVRLDVPLPRRSDHGVRRRARPAAARAPRTAPRTERSGRRSRHVVGRRSRRTTA